MRINKAVNAQRYESLAKYVQAVQANVGVVSDDSGVCDRLQGLSPWEGPARGRGLG